MFGSSSNPYPVHIESDLQITLKGINDETASKLGEAVASFIRAFAESEAPLDFRRMHQVVVTTDFAGELDEVSQRTKSKNLITHTNEDYAIAVAKVLLLPCGEGIEILPIFNANMLLGILDDPSSERFRWVIHLLHHEFCHVHDDNKKLDAMPNVWLNSHYSGKDILIGPLAETCWSEYAANRLSSSSAFEPFVNSMVDTLTDALKRTKKQVDREIFEYRYHGDLKRLMDYFDRHGEFLARTAAYVIGYMDGLEKEIKELSPQAVEMLNGSYFEATWNAMCDALRAMWAVYPAGWKDIGIYQPLAAAIESYYADMGLILSTTDEEKAYVNIP